MRVLTWITVSALAALTLAACSGGMSGLDGPPILGASAHQQQVERDVRAMMQGMNNARTQSDFIARARDP